MDEGKHTSGGAGLQQGKSSIAKLEEIKLTIGDTLQLQSLAEEGRSRYYVKLIGYAVGRTVLVTTPVVDGRICFMREGQGFVIRCFSGKNAYAFQAVVLKVVNSPFPYLLLTYPREVRGLVVRRGARVHTSIIGSVQMLTGVRANTSTGVSVTNLSVGGALVAARAPLGGKGDDLLLKFRVVLDDMETFPQLEGVIRNVAVEPETDGAGALSVLHGVEFKEVPQNDRIMLTAFVYQHMLEGISDE